jgi:hypothetical protein
VIRAFSSPSVIPFAMVIPDHQPSRAGFGRVKRNPTFELTGLNPTRPASWAGNHGRARPEHNPTTHRLARRPVTSTLSIPCFIQLSAHNSIEIMKNENRQCCSFTTPQSSQFSNSSS